MKKQKQKEPNYKLFEEVKSEIDECAKKSLATDSLVRSILKIQAILWHTIWLCVMLVVGIPQLYIVSMRVLITLLFIGYFVCNIRILIITRNSSNFLLRQSGIIMSKLKPEEIPQFTDWLLCHNGNKQ